MAAGNDLLFDEALCQQGKNFANKIWNAHRLIQSWDIDDSIPQDQTGATTQVDVAPKTIFRPFKRPISQELNNLTIAFLSGAI